MSTRVGTKGQVVIEKSIRDELGVEPGWIAFQRIVGGDRVEVRFHPAEHDRSLRGALAQQIERSIPPEGFDQARRDAWGAVAKRRMTGEP